MDDTPRSRRWYERLPPPLRGRPVTLIRRALAAALFLVAAALAAQPATAGGEPAAKMLVSARDLPLGTTLRPADVRLVHVPESMRPAGALGAPDAVDGRVLAGAAREGEPITDVRLLGSRSTPPGTTTVPVRLADSGIAGLLRPGARVDVVTLGTDHTRDTGDAGDEVLASMATVLTVIGPASPARDGPDHADDGPLVLLATPTDVAAQLAAATLGRPVTVTLR
ncbi:Flp pilus assembly protein CpaB [Qaidamihabitans albus]|uniref:Flp pilus assembly protein CpaB n=1 Tax=Qaidamihabitans albus TaxID=2795733 RepID=UPI0018F2111F|nr:Flp pilus assembly protein CpaB [Qaidamihabitans albus]